MKLAHALKFGFASTICGATLALCAGGNALATEGAGTNLTLGATTFQTPIFSPPGFFYEADLNQYESSRLNDDTGHKLIPGFQINETALYNQVGYVAPVSFHGVQVAVGAVIPFIFVGERAEGQRQYIQNMADTLLQPLILGWNKDDVYVALVQGVYVPDGEYRPQDLVTLSRDTWEYQPQISVGYINQTGLEATTTVTYILSQVNKNPMAVFTNPFGSAYHSGNELAADYAVGYNFTPNFEAGVTGYVYEQTTADKLTDPYANAVFQQYFDGYFGKTLAVGPGFRYLTKYGAFLGEIQQEVYSKNRTQGSSYWLRWAITF